MLTKSDSITIAVTLVIFVLLVLFLCICCFRHECYCPCNYYDETPDPPEESPSETKIHNPPPITPPIPENTHSIYPYDDTIDAVPGQTGRVGGAIPRPGSINAVTPRGDAGVVQHIHNHGPPTRAGSRRNSDFDVASRLEGGILRVNHNNDRRRPPNTSQVAFQAGSDTFDAVIPEDRTSGGEDSGFDVVSDRERSMTRPARAAVRGERMGGRGRARG